MGVKITTDGTALQLPGGAASQELNHDVEAQARPKPAKSFPLHAKLPAVLQREKLATDTFGNRAVRPAAFVLGFLFRCCRLPLERPAARVAPRQNVSPAVPHGPRRKWSLVFVGLLLTVLSLCVLLKYLLTGASASPSTVPSAPNATAIPGLRLTADEKLLAACGGRGRGSTLPSGTPVTSCAFEVEQVGVTPVPYLLRANRILRIRPQLCAVVLCQAACVPM